MAKLDIELDDLKTLVVESGHSLDKITLLEDQYVKQYEDIVAQVVALYFDFKSEPDRKSIAMKHSKNKWFKFAMQMYDGRTPNYKDIWEKEYLKSYSLKTVYSDFNHEEVS